MIFLLKLKSKIKIVLILILFSMVIKLYGQSNTIIVDKGKYIIDENLKMIVCNNNIDEINFLSHDSSLNIILDRNQFKFKIVPDELEYGEEYSVYFNSENYQLFFSELPIIKIATNGIIQDEPKILGSLLLTDNESSVAISSYCAIEIRGGSSQFYPKKSYDFELLLNQAGDKKNKISLLGMREDDDWLLLSMQNEPLRLRNVVSHILWREIHQPYYVEEVSSGIRMEYIELAINDEYMGLYALSEQIDRKQLQLVKADSVVRGELYKGINGGEVSTFDSLVSYDNKERIWSDFEMKYPKEDELTDWSNIYNFVDFVINADDVTFENEITKEFRINNAIDYFIFMNLTYPTDNTGKNLYIAKYDIYEPYFYIPWDLDGTFGLNYKGNRVNITDDTLSNGLYDRLIISNDIIFNNGASNRWFDLRNNILKEDNLTENILVKYNFLSKNGNYIRESLKWGQESIDHSILEYTYEWLSKRIEFLDDYFRFHILGIKENTLSPEHLNIYPNPVTSTFKIIKTEEKSFNYYIFDISGILLNQGFISSKDSINVKHLSSGTYFLKIIDNETRLLSNVRFIKR